MSGIKVLKMQLLQTDEHSATRWWGCWNGQCDDVSWYDVMWPCRVESYAVSHVRNDRGMHRLDPRLFTCTDIHAHTGPTYAKKVFVKTYLVCFLNNYVQSAALAELQQRWYALMLM